MSPAQALVAATSSAAELLGMGDELGTLEPGKRADFVVVRGDGLNFDGLEGRVEQVPARRSSSRRLGRSSACALCAGRGGARRWPDFRFAVNGEDPSSRADGSSPITIWVGAGPRSLPSSTPCLPAGWRGLPSAWLFVAVPSRPPSVHRQRVSALGMRVRTGVVASLTALACSGALAMPAAQAAVPSAAPAVLAPTVSPVTPAAAPTRTITYDVRSRGDVAADAGAFERIAAATLTDQRGWSMGGSIRFAQVAGGGEFTLWLASPSQMPSFSAKCSPSFSCRAGRNVVINEERWRTGTATWPAVAEYRQHVINHEVGHWLGWGTPTAPRRRTGAGDATAVQGPRRLPRLRLAHRGRARRGRQPRGGASCGVRRPRCTPSRPSGTTPLWFAPWNRAPGMPPGRWMRWWRWVRPASSRGPSPSPTTTGTGSTTCTPSIRPAPPEPRCTCSTGRAG